MRPGRSGAPAAGAADGGPSLEHATALFKDGKLDETIAELKSISPQHPDYARAQKMLATLTRKTGAGEAAGSSEAAPGGCRAPRPRPARRPRPSGSASRPRRPWPRSATSTP